MATRYFGMADEHADAMDNLNLFFAIVFTAECAVKLVGLGPRRYWMSGWNRFDAVIVTMTNAGILFDVASGGRMTGGSDQSAIRALRILRVVRLMHRAPGLRRLIAALLVTLPSLGNISSLLFLMYFIYAVLGMQVGPAQRAAIVGWGRAGAR
jgi:hypothetical protein